MAPVDLFCFLLCCHLVLLLSTGYGNGHPYNCPPSFSCGHLGTFHYPFTKAELPDCGLLPIHGCDADYYSPKTIQLEKHGKPKMVTGVVADQNTITLFDEDFHRLLQNKTCDALNNNYSLPSPSPLVSFYIKYNVTLFRCNHSLNIQPPALYFQHKCGDYDIYYDSHPPYNEEARSFFSSCSVLQFPSKDLTDTPYIPSFVSGQMVVKVVLSADCDECSNQRRGQCRLGGNKKFYCDNAAEPKNKRKILKLLLGLGIGVGLPGLIITGLVIIWLCKRRVPDFYSTNLYPESGSVYLGVPVFSYQDLELATKNFDHSRELGEGGFGTVYYGKLKDGREVAVKRLYEHNYKRVEQFMNEIKILTRLRHSNLVSLYGCTSRHSRGLLLVYEYISNGTVASHLRRESTDPLFLPWHIRMKVALETASALAYLHASEIIHRDVKTNNILLDNTFCVKVADFGLSKLFPNDVTHVSTAPQGTPGYVDPEYHQCYRLTSKSDVYSFGVVLVELISSMPAVDMTRHNDDINLANLATRKIQKNAISELVDPSLGFESDSDIKRKIVSIAELAFQCLQRDKELRPSMDEVLEVLRRIESGKDEPRHLEEVIVQGAGMSHIDVHALSPPSPDHDEVKLLKNMKLTPSPKAVTDKWDSESTTPNFSGQSASQI